MSAKEMRKLLGPRIGMVFQDCKASLCPVRKVGDQICESINQHERVSEKQILARTEELMSRVGLTDFRRIWNSYPFELSGGMNQRVGICMAMLQKPSLLLGKSRAVRHFSPFFLTSREKIRKIEHSFGLSGPSHTEKI